MAQHPPPYLMENPDEILRLEKKTAPETVVQQAHWCGIKRGQRLLDVGCGPGKTTSLLFQMVQPKGEVLGIDLSEERIRYAIKNYGDHPGIRFAVHDFISPLADFGQFDIIWARFILEYHKQEALDIVRNLAASIKPGGTLCLLDLDYNCMTHYPIPENIRRVLADLMVVLERDHNFDPYAGRKLYSHLYDLDFQEIQVNLMAHHLIYGELDDINHFNWIKKAEVLSSKTRAVFESYPEGPSGFQRDFFSFFKDPRRFSYTPVIICKGSKPQ